MFSGLSADVSELHHRTSCSPTIVTVVLNRLSQVYQAYPKMWASHNAGLMLGHRRSATVAQHQISIVSIHCAAQAGTRTPIDCPSEQKHLYVFLNFWADVKDGGQEFNQHCVSGSHSLGLCTLSMKTRQTEHNVKHLHLKYIVMT